MYSLEQLLGFVTVAKELHFSRAAEKLQMTQPPLSRQIQKLESIVGVKLFLRNNRSVELTPAGETFYEDAKHILHSVQQSMVSARKVQAGEAGDLTMGYTASSALTVLGPLLDTIEAEIPQVRVSLHELVSQKQLERVITGTLDIGLSREAPVRSELQSRLMTRGRLIAALPQAHRLAQPGAVEMISPENFHHEHMIMYSREGAQYFNELVRPIIANYEPYLSQQTSQIHTMLALVSAGRGMAIVPESAQRFNLHGVVYKPIAGWQEPLVELYAVWRRDYRNPVLHNVLRLLDPTKFVGEDYIEKV